MTTEDKGVPQPLAARLERAVRGLGGVIGQDHAVSTLRSALARGRPHHAYLFDGPEGVGKATCALALFAAMNCESPPRPGDACGDCRSCAKVLSLCHPDLILFDMSLSGLADQAEALIRRLAFRPHEGRVQMVIFDPADHFGAPTAVTAANRLLKSIEEPVPRTHFVMITASAQVLLPTLRSRMQRLRFMPLADALIDGEVAPHTRDAAQRASIVKLSQGSLGRALTCLTDSDGLARREEAAAALRQAAAAGHAGRIVEIAAEVGRDRDEASDTLDLLWLKLHAELLAALRGPPRAAEELVRAMRLLRETQEAISGYTNPAFCLERLLREMAAGGGLAP